MLKAGIVVASVIVVVTVAAGIGSKLASGKSDNRAWSAPRISPHEMMLKFDMTQPAEEVNPI
jgi:hypothetical protein